MVAEGIKIGRASIGPFGQARCRYIYLDAFERSNPPVENNETFYKGKQSCGHAFVKVSSREKLCPDKELAGQQDWIYRSRCMGQKPVPMYTVLRVCLYAQYFYRIATLAFALTRSPARPGGVGAYWLRFHSRSTTHANAACLYT